MGARGLDLLPAAPLSFRGMSTVRSEVLRELRSRMDPHPTSLPSSGQSSIGVSRIRRCRRWQRMFVVCVWLVPVLLVELPVMGSGAKPWLVVSVWPLSRVGLKACVPTSGQNGSVRQFSGEKSNIEIGAPVRAEPRSARALGGRGGGVESEVAGSVLVPGTRVRLAAGEVTRGS